MQEIATQAKIYYLCLQATRQSQASYAHVHEIIKGLEKRDWKVTLFQPRYAEEKQLPGILKKFSEYIQVQLRLWTFFPQPDLIYIRFHPAALPTIWWARMRGIPLVLEVNGPFEDLYLAWPWTKRIAKIYETALKYAFDSSSGLISVTTGLTEWLARISHNPNIFCVGNGANADVFKPGLARPANIDLPPEYVVFFGALAPWQGIQTMIEATHLPEWPFNIPLLIVGDGNERSLILEETKTNSLIKYLPPQPYTTIASIVSNALMGLSIQNNYQNRSVHGLVPLKALETISCGIPLIVSDFPGIGEIVKKYQCGFCIPPENPEALAEAVASLFRNHPNRVQMGNAGRYAILEEHSWDQKASQTDKILRKFLTRRANAVPK